jgi:hypothetical protein
METKTLYEAPVETVAAEITKGEVTEEVKVEVTEATNFDITQIKVPKGFKVIVDADYMNRDYITEELNGCLVLLEEQEQIKTRLNEKLIGLDEELTQIVQEKIDTVEENKRWNLIKIGELTEKLK